MPWTAKQHRPRSNPKRPRERRARLPFYDSADWKKFRIWYLSSSPMCADPFGYHAEDGKQVVAVDVDHITPIATDPDGAFDADNVQGLCKACHARKTNRERN